MIHCLAGDRPKRWDEALSQAEFALNSMANRSTGKATFSIVYTKAPNHTLDLITLPQTKSHATESFAQQIANLHQEVRDNLLHANDQYKASADKHRRFKTFNEGDLVMIHLTKTRLPAGTNPKLHDKKIGPYHIKKKINDNAYIIDLPSHLQISPIFNVSDLYDYFPPDEANVDEVHSETSSILGGKD